MTNNVIHVDFRLDPQFEKLSKNLKRQQENVRRYIDFMEQNGYDVQTERRMHAAFEKMNTAALRLLKHCKQTSTAETNNAVATDYAREALKRGESLDEINAFLKSIDDA